MIFFIGGAGRSGSTLLDMSLGQNPNHFSTGELVNLVKNGILGSEYCSCGQRVLDCVFWSEVINKWNVERILSLENFARIQWKYLRNKKTLSSIWNYYLPSDDYKALVHDTNALLEIIVEVSGKENIVDSSKTPQYLLLLKRTNKKIKIIHLTRKLKNVIESNRKVIEKDLKKGIEKSIGNRRYSYIALTWFMDNFFVFCFSLFRDVVRIEYEKFIDDPIREISKIYEVQEEMSLLENRGPLRVEHMVAGGRIRMSSNVYIKQKSKSIKSET